ncbi:MAG: 50S ribosomal protein L18 [Candidatus Aenigmarchaeota archaeon]|nr:50S ribosomal protein L18 [Candidatus Aenigmarchaeota archaeon]
MARKIVMRLAHRRRREGRTDYRARLALLKSGQPRLVIRKSLSNMSCQIVIHGQKGDTTAVAASSKELAGFGWKSGTGNLPAAYLTGLLLGAKAKAAKIETCIADLGLYTQTNGSRIYACLKGAVDSGLNIPHSPEIFPAENRLSGKHIADYAAKVKSESQDKYQSTFSAYISAGVAPESLPSAFESTKSAILSGSGAKAAPKKEAKAADKAEKPKKAKKG